MLTDGLPALGATNLWSISGGANAGSFTITGPAGSQQLALSGVGTLAAGASLSVHIVGITTTTSPVTLANAALDPQEPMQAALQSGGADLAAVPLWDHGSVNPVVAQSDVVVSGGTPLGEDVFAALHSTRLLLRPYVGYVQDFAQSGFFQPWNPALISNFKHLNPVMVKAGQFQGKQWGVPADWGPWRQNIPSAAQSGWRPFPT